MRTLFVLLAASSLILLAQSEGCEQDKDGDGWTTEDGDCNDTDPEVHPGATETLNGIDDNCDGQIDEELYATSCLDLLEKIPESPSGSYTLDPDGDGSSEPMETYCDMDSDGGGWTLTYVEYETDPGDYGSYPSPDESSPVNWDSYLSILNAETDDIAVYPNEWISHTQERVFCIEWQDGDMSSYYQIDAYADTTSLWDGTSYTMNWLISEDEAYVGVTNDGLSTQFHGIDQAGKLNGDLGGSHAWESPYGIQGCNAGGANNNNDSSWDLLFKVFVR